MSFLGFIPDSALPVLENAGIQIEKWVLSEAHKLAGFFLQDKGVVGLMASVIQTLMSHDIPGSQKMDIVARSAVPLAVQLITQGKSAVPVVETDIIAALKIAGQVVLTDVEKLPTIGPVVSALGL